MLLAVMAVGGSDAFACQASGDSTSNLTPSVFYTQFENRPDVDLITASSIAGRHATMTYVVFIYYPLPRLAAMAFEVCQFGCLI